MRHYWVSYLVGKLSYLFSKSLWIFEVLYGSVVMHLHYAFGRYFYPKWLTFHWRCRFYHAFPGNRTHDLSIACTMLCCLSYRVLMCFLKRWLRCVVEFEIFESAELALEELLKGSVCVVLNVWDRYLQKFWCVVEWLEWSLLCSWILRDNLKAWLVVQHDFCCELLGFGSSEKEPGGMWCVFVWQSSPYAGLSMEPSRISILLHISLVALTAKNHHFLCVSTS